MLSLWSDVHVRQDIEGQTDLWKYNISNVVVYLTEDKYTWPFITLKKSKCSV